MLGFGGLVASHNVCNATNSNPVDPFSHSIRDLQRMSSDLQALLASAEQAQGVVVNNDFAISFLERFPLPELFRVFSTERLSENDLAQLCNLLSKVLQTDFGTSLLPEARQYIEAALQSEHLPLRRLGCEQLGRMLNTALSTNIQAEAATRLLTVLEENGTGLVVEAERALKQYGSQADRLKFLLNSDHAPGHTLQNLLHSSNPTVRLRALAVLIGIASQNFEGLDLVRQSGLLDPLLKELRNTADPLSCLAALQTLQDLAQQAAGASGSSVVVLAMPSVMELLADSSLRQQALPIAAGMLAAAIQDAQQGEASASLAAAAAPLLALLAGILDERGNDTAEAEAVALDAAGTLAVSTSGAALVAEAAGGQLLAAAVGHALGRAADPDVRIAALHATASLAGAQRAGPHPSLQLVQLTDQVEARLRSEVYRAGAFGPGGAGTPAGCLHALLSQPFLELRVATYRLISALALRPWFAAEVCRHPDLLDHLLDPKRETGQRGCEWRHVAATALLAGVNAAAALPGGHGDAPLTAGLLPLLGRVSEAVRAGPYGAGVTTRAPPEFLVATLP